MLMSSMSSTKIPPSDTQPTIIENPWFWISIVLIVFIIILLILLFLGNEEKIKFPVLSFNDLTT